VSALTPFFDDPLRLVAEVAVDVGQPVGAPARLFPGETAVVPARSEANEVPVGMFVATVNATVGKDVALGPGRPVRLNDLAANETPSQPLLALNLVDPEAHVPASEGPTEATNPSLRVSITVGEGKFPDQAVVGNHADPDAHT
jgi:hypothetical protein